jgi:inner membrane protein
MPTIMTHSIVAVSVGFIFRGAALPKRFWVLGIIAAVLPDADVIGYQYLYIPYGHILGHRGLFHSPCFSALFSVVIVSLFFRRERFLSRGWWAYVLFFFAVGASHGLLDAMTDGGRGVALLAPYSNERYFLPWTPIEVSPLGVQAFFSRRGLSVMKSELLWVWLPAATFVILWWMIRRNYSKSKTRSSGPVEDPAAGSQR